MKGFLFKYNKNNRNLSIHLVKINAYLMKKSLTEQFITEIATNKTNILVKMFWPILGILMFFSTIIS